MNPIPTTNAMKPAAGKGISSFPTPVIKDTVIVEVVNTWKGDYIPLEYGAKWDDHPHASQQGNFPDHKLINQAPTSEDGQWVKRIWANDRVDQDTYNYAIKYSGGSDAHPIYIRTYLEPRDTYAPVLDGTADPLFPGAFLVDEEVTRTDGEFDSRYVQVTRVYETLPGPVIPTKRINERGDLETVNTQVVPPNTAPDPDGLLVTQTQVAQEEVSKGVKTTATVPSHSQLLVKEKKEGLLGETITTDDIVDPATTPDNLTTSIVASTVQQVSKTKAVKRTTTASGPTSLAGRTINSFGVSETITESIVVPEQSVDLTGLVVADQISPIDSAKSKRERRVLVNMPDNYDYYETVSNEKVVIKNTVQILRRNDPLNPIPVPVVDSITLDVKDTPLEFPWIRRVTKSIPTNLPPSRIEWDVITYTFPGIIYSWKARLQNGEVKASLTFFENRYPISMTVASRNEISYHAENDPALDLSSLEFFRVITRPWARIYFNIPDNTIHPPAPITITGQSVERGGIAFDISGGQGSEPSFYTPGDEILIGAETKLWWGGIYIKKLVYVKEPI